MSVIEHKCPRCGAHIEFDQTAQKMVCSFCDSAFDMEELLAAEDIRNPQSEDASPSAPTSKPAWDVVSGGGEVEIGRAHV